MMMGRFKLGQEVVCGEVLGDEAKIIIAGKERVYPLQDLTILPPAVPSKVVCVGLNYSDHARELGMAIPAYPLIFLKPPSSVIAHLEHIVYPKESKRVDYEAELAVIIGKRCKNVKSEEAEEVIKGYTCFNDVTARDLQQADGQWTRAKGFDTFAPMGPFLMSCDLDVRDLAIKTRVNGEVRQCSNTSNLIFAVPYLIEFISHIMTLEEGDVIATGTPPGVGSLQVGDEVEIEIEGIGILKNRVVG